MLFVTSNKEKFNSLQRILVTHGLPSLTHVNIEVPEVLASPAVVAMVKASMMLKKFMETHPEYEGGLCIEDTSLDIASENLSFAPVEIKNNIASLPEYAGCPATWVSSLCVADTATRMISYYTYAVEGTIVVPEVLPPAGFGFDAYLQPKGETGTCLNNPRYNARFQVFCKFFRNETPLSVREYNPDIGKEWSGKWQS